MNSPLSAHTPTGVASVTRLRPLDRQRPVPSAPVQGELALSFDPAPGLPPERPELTLVRNAVPDVQAFATRFAQGVVEVVLGDRGVHQLMRWTSEEVYADLQARTESLRRTVPGEQRVRRLRAQVRSVHVFRPASDVAELSVHVAHGQRSRAIAGRLELRDGRWQCTVLQFG